MKYYIAGPMTGYENYNREAFNAAAKMLESENHIAINPAVLPGGLSQSDYMDICLAMVRACDCVYMLKGWEHSGGARAEFWLADKLGKIICYEQKNG